LSISALVVVLAVGTAGLVTLRPAALFGVAGQPAVTPGLTVAPPPSPVLAGANSNAPIPSSDAVAAALAGPLSDTRLGGHVSLQVVDVATGQQLYARNQADPTTPASTMKLATSVAVLALRGPAYQLQTVAVAGANPGEIVIIGGGDPTLAINAIGSYPGAARLDNLANQVKQALGGAPLSKVTVDSSLFPGPNTGPNWDLTDIDPGGQVARITALLTDGGRIKPTQVAPPSSRYGSPDIAAGQAFAKLLGVPTSAVVRGTAPAASTGPGSAGPGSAGPDTASPGPTSWPAPGTRLGVVKSPPLVRIIEQMLGNSDNTVAEMLSRQVALARNQPASFSGAAAAVLAELGDLGLPTQGVKIVDGSGLSNDNKLSAELLTAILALSARPDKPELHGLFTGLPVAGYSGTLAGRFRSPAANPADGVVRAKTGTLTSVNTMAGYVTDAGGRLLAFALLADKVTAYLLDAEAALDRVGSALAQLR
jgi:D-alanyl-D-alanine carboxypeptidase/D-alanyl-D-alanine-endopeptidase (penicillin-binding protein 4)